MNESDTATLIKYGVIGVGIYLIYKAVNGVANVGNPLAPVGTSVGGALFNFLNPNAAGSAATLTATLPNGSQAGIPAETVNADGTVTYNGTQYQMLVNPNITTGVNKTLIPLTQTQLDNAAAADQFAVM